MDKTITLTKQQLREIVWCVQERYFDDHDNAWAEVKDALDKAKPGWKKLEMNKRETNQFGQVIISSAYK